MLREKRPRQLSLRKKRDADLPKEHDRSEDDADEILPPVDGSEITEKSPESQEASESSKQPKKKRRPLTGGEYQKVSDRGVLLIGHLPPGFLEPQLRKFFRQFGDITRFRLVRSKKTGRSKNYAFIEFASKEVAEIASQTMNGYLMFGRTLKCRIIPSTDIHSAFHNNSISYMQLAVREILKCSFSDAEMTESQASHKLEKEVSKLEKIKALGIDYTPPTLTRQ
ncbi:MKI67 FHA domain-interacting nucleolar phosphoprotein-like [Condylostylus longicornis]|uniref:MKI67 FHA domain-interacting nucleolar phosphoprotein-like n=1 Tax=Condylostylus longicornis TaxID=2530218 RepID=UPI00244DF7BF|nr:MKI67 FHA domain-interacting nucleolar phosphoprotein-like [Condylostylus longicornis]